MKKHKWSLLGFTSAAILSGLAVWQAGEYAAARNKSQKLALLQGNERHQSTDVTTECVGRDEVESSEHLQLTLNSPDIPLFHPCTGVACRLTNINIPIQLDVIRCNNLTNITCTMNTENALVIYPGAVKDYKMDVYPELPATVTTTTNNGCWITQPLAIDSYWFPQSSFTLYLVFRLSWDGDNRKIRVEETSVTVDQECRNAKRSSTGTFQRLGSNGAVSSLSTLDGHTAHHLLMPYPDGTFALFERVDQHPVRMWTGLLDGIPHLLYRFFDGRHCFRVVTVSGSIRHHHVLDEAWYPGENTSHIHLSTADKSVIVADYPGSDSLLVVVLTCGVGVYVKRSAWENDQRYILPSQNGQVFECVRDSSSSNFHIVRV